MVLGARGSSGGQHFPEDIDVLGIYSSRPAANKVAEAHNAEAAGGIDDDDYDDYDDYGDDDEYDYAVYTFKVPGAVKKGQAYDLIFECRGYASTFPEEMSPDALVPAGTGGDRVNELNANEMEYAAEERGEEFESVEEYVDWCYQEGEGTWYDTYGNIKVVA